MQVAFPLFQHIQNLVGCKVGKKEINNLFFSMNQLNPFEENTNITDWSTERRDILTFTKPKGGKKAIAFYIRGHFFQSYKFWQRTVHGKQILRILHTDETLKGHLKCIFFDSQISNNTVVSELYVNQFISQVLDYILALNDAENIVCMSCCRLCNTIGTLKYFDLEMPLIMDDYKVCRRCYKNCVV